MEKILRRIVFKYEILFQIYYKYIYRPPKGSISYYLNKLSAKRRIKFIQIGANDGFYDDPLYKYIRRDKWEGILIEPQKVIFNRLVKNYRKMKNLYFENIAISTVKESRKLYKIAFTDMDWASGLSSFNLEALKININAGYVERKAKENGIKLPENINEWVSTEIIECSTINEVIKKYNLKKIDLLMIDAEGYDIEIIKNIDFNNIKPSNIIYEHTHFALAENLAIEEYLKNYGYQIIKDLSDTIASIIIN
jgi:FkbM family methyltransferase